MGSACSYECNNAQTQKNLQRKKKPRVSTIKIDDKDHLHVEFTEQSLGQISADLLIVFVDSSNNLAKNKHFQQFTNEANGLAKRLGQKVKESQEKKPFVSFQFPALATLKFKYFSFVTCPIWTKKEEEEKKEKDEINVKIEELKKQINQLLPVVQQQLKRDNSKKEDKDQLDGNIKSLQQAKDKLQHAEDKLKFGTLYGQLLRDLKQCFHDLQVQRKNKEIKSIAIAQFTENFGIIKKKGINAVVQSIIRSQIKPEWVKVRCLTEISKNAFADHFDNAYKTGHKFDDPSKAQSTYN